MTEFPYSFSSLNGALPQAGKTNVLTVAHNTLPDMSVKLKFKESEELGAS